MSLDHNSEKKEDEKANFATQEFSSDSSSSGEITFDREVTDIKDGIYNDVNSMNDMEFNCGETISKLRHVK